MADAAEGIADAALEAVEGYNRRKQKPVKARNEQLPAHLPRIEVLLPVPEDQRFCPEHGERTVAGFDWQESLQIVPAKLVVVRTGIPKCVCKGHDECGVVEAPRPVGLVEGNRYDTSVAAQIITHKYSYHLPIYRQQDIFASCGWTPARSPLLNILRAAAECIAVFVTHLREVVRAGPIIGTDDTTVTLLTPSDLPPLDPLDPKTTRTREVIAAAHATVSRRRPGVVVLCAHNQNAVWGSNKFGEFRRRPAFLAEQNRQDRRELAAHLDGPDFAADVQPDFLGFANGLVRDHVTAPPPATGPRPFPPFPGPALPVPRAS